MWRVVALTLNYGLRWEPFFAAKDQNGFNMAFVRENFDKGVQQHGVSERARPGWCSPAIRASRQRRQHDQQSASSSRRAPASSGIRSGDNVRRFARPRALLRLAKLWQYGHHMLNPPYGNTVTALAADVVPAAE